MAKKTRTRKTSTKKSTSPKSKKETAKKAKAEEVEKVEEQTTDAKEIEEEVKETKAPVEEKAESKEAESTEEAKEEVKETKAPVESPALASAPEFVKVAIKEGTTMCQFRKIGGGSFLLGKNKIVKPGERFWYPKDDIPSAFKNTLEVLQEFNPQVMPEEMKPKFELEGEKDEWFVVNKASGKAINDSAFNKKDAEKLLEKLNG